MLHSFRISYVYEVCGAAVGRGSALKARRLWVWFMMMSLGLFI